jgi:hypothetical protein
MQKADLSWLHVSDFHLGKDPHGQEEVCNHILDEVFAVSESWREPDFIFITGDVANRGRSEEFELFDANFVIPLVSKLGDKFLSRTFVIPGNHDVDRTQAKAVRRYDVLEEVPEFLDPTPEGAAERASLLARFRAFDECRWSFENALWVNSSDGFLARKFSIGAFDVGVLCINTAWFCGSDNEKFRLTPGRSMVEAGLRQVAGCYPIFVLGHHPIDWFPTSDAKQIRAMFAKSSAIYLHGHLHKTEQQTVYSGTRRVVTLQAGCAFFARTDEKWITRLLWGAMESSSKRILLRPKKWLSDHHEWGIDGDALPDSMRAPGGDYWIIPELGPISPVPPAVSTAPQGAKADISTPEGWINIDSTFWSQQVPETSDERILQYFDGRVPIWPDILSKRIPERTIVADLVTTITDAINTGSPQITLLLGPGGEGKSTAFLQALYTSAQRGTCNVVWRAGVERGLPTAFVTGLGTDSGAWLFASDEADSLVRDVYNAMKEASGKQNIHFFLTCRDTDWIANEGDDFAWNTVGAFIERRIKGLDHSDATAIVRAWSNYGTRGLGKLSGLDPEEAAEKLFEAAKLEAISTDGAFLGAMLRVRVGLALKDHVGALLARLDRREIQGYPGKTLLEAFALIAIPHAFNLLFLSKPVLAKALAVDELRLRRRVLGPLGEEAAATAQGQYVLTRHRAIAEAAMEMLTNRFHFDPEDILAELVTAAITLGTEGVAIPNIAEWRFLSSRMFAQGNQVLGIRLASAALAADPTNSFLAVKLSQLHREAGHPDQSVEVFRRSVHRAQGNRAFFTEWGTAEGAIGNSAVSVWLKSVSISDRAEMRPPDIKDTYLGLSGCAISFNDLFERYQEAAFLHAAIASAELCLGIPVLTEKTREILAGELQRSSAFAAPRLNASERFPAFVNGLRLAYQQREVELLESIPVPVKLTFEAVQRYCRFAM